MRTRTTMKRASKTKTKPKRQLWVIKAGSQMVISGGSLLIRHWMAQVTELKHRHGIDCIWVTSGAIATAKKRLTQTRGLKLNQPSLSQKQALSAIGQPLVAEQYGLALGLSGGTAAQVLLTADDTSHKGRRQNLMKSLNCIIEMGAVPILNENDAVATEEIEFGDNDRLSALVAKLMTANQLVILTDVEGLYDSDPNEARKRGEAAQLISELEKVTPKIMRMATGTSSSGLGKGGMASKLKAARIANSVGIPTHLAKGDLPEVLLKIASNADAGWPGTRLGVFAKKGRKK